MKFLEKIIVYMILVSPLFISINWHYVNTQIPSSDAVDWLSTAIDINENLYNGDFFSFIKEFLTDRPWRPIIFHIFLSPILLLTHGDILLTTLIIHAFFTSLSIYFLFSIFRVFSSPILSALGTSLICISSDILFGGASHTLFAEIALFPFVLGAIFFLIRSNYFSNKKDSYLFSLFFFLSISVRPIEALIYMILPLTFIVIKGLKKKFYTRLQLINILKIPFTALSILFLSRLLNQESRVYHIDYPNSGKLFLYITIISVFITLFIYISHIIIKNKELKALSSNKDNYFKNSIIIFTFFAFIWWAPYFSNLYEWVYNTSIGSIVSYYKPNTNYFEVAKGIIEAYGSYTIIILFLLVIFNFFLQKVKKNYKFLDEKLREFIDNINLVFLLFIPIPLLLYFFSVQNHYRKVSFVMIAITSIFIIYLINNKIKYFTVTGLTFLFLMKFNVAISITDLSYQNDKWWNNNNTKDIYHKVIGKQYPIPINITPNPHNTVLNFFKDINENNKLGHIGLVFNEFSDPVDAWVLQLMCKQNNITCSLVYTTTLEFLHGELDKYKNRYDIFYFINPPEVKMEVSDIASYKLKEMMHNKYFSPFARLSYFIQYLYATKSFNEYNMSINKCHDISLKFKGCFVSFK